MPSLNIFIFLSYHISHAFYLYSNSVYTIYLYLTKNHQTSQLTNSKFIVFTLKINIYFRQK